MDGFTYFPKIFRRSQAKGNPWMTRSNQGIQITGAWVDLWIDFRFVHYCPRCFDQWMGKRDSAILSLGYDFHFRFSSSLQ